MTDPSEVASGNAGAGDGSEPSMPTVVTLRSQVPGAVSAKVSEIGGRPAVEVEFDGTDKRGALSQDDGETIAAAARLAWQQRLPLVASIASSGADVEEGVSALVGWGTAARELVRCSGVVPIILVVTGPAVSGPALLLGLADFVILTADAYAFVSGPRMVTEFTGVPITPTELGGAGPHARSSGVAALDRRRPRRRPRPRRGAALAPPAERGRGAASDPHRRPAPTASRPS